MVSNDKLNLINSLMILNILGELQEYLIIPTDSSEDSKIYWTTQNTKILLDLYKLFRKQVGTMKIRNFKKMWEAISHEMKQKYQIYVTPGHCENRWRVLERNFKKYVDDSKKTGMGRKHFEYHEEMYDVLGKKKNVCPQLVLSTQTIDQNKNDTEKPRTSISSNPDVSTEVAAKTTKATTVSLAEVTSKDEPTIAKKNKITVTRRSVTKNSDVLEKIRCDKRVYQENRIKYEKEKSDKLFNLEREKVDIQITRNNLLKEKNDLMKEQNNLMKERNKLLREFVNNSAQLPFPFVVTND